MKNLGKIKDQSIRNYSYIKRLTDKQNEIIDQLNIVIKNQEKIKKAVKLHNEIFDDMFKEVK